MAMKPHNYKEFRRYQNISFWISLVCFILLLITIGLPIIAPELEFVASHEKFFDNMPLTILLADYMLCHIADRDAHRIECKDYEERLEEAHEEIKKLKAENKELEDKKQKLIEEKGDK